MTQTFGENVRARRLELGMTLQQVADGIGGYTKQNINTIEFRLGRPRQKTVNSYCELFGESGYVSDLRTGHGFFVRHQEDLNRIMLTDTVDKPRKKRTVKK